MKLLAVLLSVVVATNAVEGGWSNLVPRDIYPADLQPILSPYEDSRIVGGKEASAGQFPYQAALRITVGSQSYFCGGALIKDDVVLTAAHCVDGASSVNVQLGAWKLNSVEEAEQLITVPKGNIVIHAQWASSIIANDIALLRLPVKARLGPTIQVISLATNASNTYASTVCVASGWGKASDAASSVSNELRYVDLSVITNTACKNYFSTYVRDGNICTSGVGGTSTCNGDSGGPLVYGSGSNAVLVGLTSFGSSLGCERGYPAVFTRVTYYLNWIRSNAGM